MRSSRAPRSRKLAAPFVVTISSVGIGLAALACHDGPPPNEPRTTQEEATPHTAADAGPRFVRRLANPMGPNAQPIHVSKQQECWTQGATVSRKKFVTCPTGIDVEAWAAKCADQLVVEEPPDTCWCETFEDPPYTIVPCPKHP